MVYKDMEKQKNYMKNLMKKRRAESKSEPLPNVQNIHFLLWHSKITILLVEFNKLYPEYKRHKYYKLYWTKKILPVITTIKRKVVKILDKNTKQLLKTKIEYTYDE